MKLNRFEQLVNEARRERPPAIDVRDQVMQSVQSLGGDTMPTSTQTFLVAGSSLALAAGFALLCFPVWRAETSALTFLFESVAKTLP